jgi:hypothetical protein
MYINGVLDVSGSPRGPYKGIKGNLTIGTVLYAANAFWDGCIDQMAYYPQARK